MAPPRHRRGGRRLTFAWVDDRRRSVGDRPVLVLLSPDNERDRHLRLDAIAITGTLDEEV